MVIGEFILMYLLFPLIAVVLAAITYIVAKKNQLLSNKKLIFVFLLACLLLALPALLGFIDYWFMPYAYISLQVLYLFLGWYFLKILQSQIKDIKEKPYYVEFLFVFVVMIVAGALFSLVFNLCNELQYGLWACTCILPFIFPSLFRKAYQTFMNIPLEIYKIWSYDTQVEENWDDDLMDSDKVTVVEMELFKQVSDTVPLNIKAKAQEDMPFGVWFKVFINDYNIKSSASPIIYSDFENSYGWIFYTITSVLGRKRYIDPDLSFAKNKIKEHRVIIAKRTRHEEFNQITD
ncbi:MAG: TssN family type VI secretion system protein [Dysgonomonas sp.]